MPSPPDSEKVNPINPKQVNPQIIPKEITFEEAYAEHIKKLIEMTKVNRDNAINALMSTGANFVQAI